MVWKCLWDNFVSNEEVLNNEQACPKSLYIGDFEWRLQKVLDKIIWNIQNGDDVHDEET